MATASPQEEDRKGSGKTKHTEEDPSPINPKRKKTTNGFAGLEFVLLDENPENPIVSLCSHGAKPDGEKPEASSSKKRFTLISKAELRDQLVELGATVSDSPTSNTYAIVTFRPQSPLAKTYIKQESHTVVHAHWLSKCVEEKKMRPPPPFDCLFAAEKTKASWEGIYDKYGDALDEDIDEDGLRRILANMGNVSRPEEDRMSSKKSPSYFLFFDKNFYLDTMKTIGDTSTEEKSSSLEITGLDIQRYSGEVSKVFDSRVTHVIVQSPARAQVFLKEKKEHDWDFELVSPQWVDRCIQEGQLLDEEMFRLV